ncbi:hypothetical protein [Sphingobium sp. HWE2-09]|uniref:hypothetical protein n=1 Tax=Sphingobium sp. HWE2-09 TaxID=3108390 RepID=UPI002DCA426D|nr:hypothetical protein [Sphingobium sp. HWE2-09]
MIQSPDLSGKVALVTGSSRSIGRDRPVAGHGKGHRRGDGAVAPYACFGCARRRVGDGIGSA